MSLLQKKKIIIRPSGPISNDVCFRDSDAAAEPTMTDYPGSLRAGADPYGLGLNQHLWYVWIEALSCGYDAGRTMTMRFYAEDGWRNLTFPQWFPNSRVEFWAEAPDAHTPAGGDLPAWHLNESTGEVCLFRGWIRSRQVNNENEVSFDCQDALWKADDVIVVRDAEAGIQIPKLIFNVDRDDPDFVNSIKNVSVTSPGDPPYVLVRTYGSGETTVADHRMTVGEILGYLQEHYATALATIDAYPESGTLFDSAEINALDYKTGPIILENVGFTEAVRQVLRWAPEQRVVVDHQTGQWRLVAVGPSLTTTSGSSGTVDNLGAGGNGRIGLGAADLAKFGADDRIRIYHAVYDVGGIAYGPEINEEAIVTSKDGFRLLLDRPLVGRGDNAPLPYPSGSTVHLVDPLTLPTIGFSADVEPGDVQMEENLDGAYSAVKIWSMYSTTERFTLPYNSPLTGAGITLPGWDSSFESVWRKDLHEDRVNDHGIGGQGLELFKITGGDPSDLVLFFPAETSQHQEEQHSGEWNGCSLWLWSAHNDLGVQVDVRDEDYVFTIKSTATIADVGDGRGGLQVTLDAKEWNLPAGWTIETEQADGAGEGCVITADWRFPTTTRNNRLWEVGRKWYSESTEMIRDEGADPHTISCHAPRVTVFDGGSFQNRQQHALGPNMGYPQQNQGPAGAWETLATGGLGAHHVWRRANYTQQPLVDASAAACNYRGYQAPPLVQFEFEKTTITLRQARFPATGFDGLVYVRYGLERELVFGTDNWRDDAQTPDYEDLVERLWQAYSQRAHYQASLKQYGIREYAAWLDLGARGQLATVAHPAGAASGLTGFWGPMTRVSLDFEDDSVEIDFDSKTDIDSIDVRLWEDVSVQPAAKVDALKAKADATLQLAKCLSELPPAVDAPGTCDIQIRSDNRNSKVKSPAPKLQGPNHGGEVGAGVQASAAPGSSAGSGGGYSSHGSRATTTGFRDLRGEYFVIDQGNGITWAELVGAILTPDPSSGTQQFLKPQENEEAIAGLAGALGMDPGFVGAPRTIVTGSGSDAEDIVLATAGMVTDEFAGGELHILDFARGVPRPPYPIASNGATVVTLASPMSEPPPVAGVLCWIWREGRPRPDETDFPSGGFAFKDVEDNWYVLSGGVITPGDLNATTNRIEDTGSHGEPLSLLIGADPDDLAEGADYAAPIASRYHFDQTGSELHANEPTSDSEVATKSYRDLVPVSYFEAGNFSSGTSRVGRRDDGSASPISVPSGFKCEILGATGVIVAGASAGTWNMDVIADTADGGIVLLGSAQGAENEAITVNVWSSAPIATLAAGNSWLPGFRNRLGNPGNMAAELHEVTVYYRIVPTT